MGVSPPGPSPAGHPSRPLPVPTGRPVAPALSQGRRVGWGWYSAGRAPAVPSTCHREAHEPSSRARGWEQLAAAGPPNKGRFEQPGRWLRALWPADPLGMPRPTPCTAHQGPRGGGTAGPGAGRPGSVPRGPQAPVGPLLVRGRPAPGLAGVGEVPAAPALRGGLVCTAPRCPGRCPCGI